MNKRERVRNAIEGKLVDRPPLCFWRHFGNIGAEATVDAHLRFFRESGMDLMKMMCDEFFVYPLGGAKTPQDFLALRPLGKDHPYVCGQAERATQINDALKGDAYTLYNAFSPYATLKHAIGDAESMRLLHEYPEAAKHALEVISEDTCSMIEAILTESGTMGMMLPLQGAEHGRFTEEAYFELIEPTERRVIECAQHFSDHNLLHMCGWDGVANHLEWWERYDTRMVNWAVYVENLSVGQARKRWPERVLMGGFDNRPGTLLHSGTKNDIQSHARRIVSEAGKERLFIGADCSLPSDIDPNRIRWIIEAFE